MLQKSSCTATEEQNGMGEGDNTEEMKRMWRFWSVVGQIEYIANNEIVCNV